MNLKELLQKSNEIIPFRKILPLFILGGIMVIISIVLIVTEDSKVEKQYFELTINGEVTQVMQRGIYVYCEIDHEWYKLYDEIKSIVRIGDFIVKNKNSYGIIISRESAPIGVDNGTRLLNKLSVDEYRGLE